MKKQVDFYDWLKKHGVNVKIGKTPDRKRFFAELEDLRFSEKFTGYNSFNGFTSFSMDLQKSLEKLSEWLITKKDRLYFLYRKKMSFEYVFVGDSLPDEFTVNVNKFVKHIDLNEYLSINEIYFDFRNDKITYKGNKQKEIDL
jgi:hypothetical protein